MRLLVNLDTDDKKFWDEVKSKEKAEQDGFWRYLLSKYPVLADKQLFIDDRKQAIFAFASYQEIYRNSITR